MAPPTARRVDDVDELAHLFLRDPANHVYGLGDLDEPYWSASRWWRRGDAAVGLVGLPDGQDIVYAVSSADIEGTRALTADLAGEIPNTLITGVPEVAQSLRHAGRVVRWEAKHHRFWLTDLTAVPEPPSSVEPLHEPDLDDLAALYAVDPGAAFFQPAMLATDAFVGVRDNGQLIAAAGAHIVSERYDVGALGAVFTHPAHRGQGLGAAVSAGAVRRLLRRVSTIGLNCRDDNVAARRIYESMGFVATLAYDECELTG